MGNATATATTVPARRRSRCGDDDHGIRVECSKTLSTAFPLGIRFRINAKLTRREDGGEFLYSYFGRKPEVLANAAKSRKADSDAMSDPCHVNGSTFSSSRRSGLSDRASQPKLLLQSYLRPVASDRRPNARTSPSSQVASDRAASR
jgi:hypothetical protein